MTKEIEILAIVTLASLTGCGGTPSKGTSPSAKSESPASPVSAPDARPYGYEFAAVTPEIEKTKPAPPATLPTAPGGRLFPEAISGVVRSHFDEIDRCYDVGHRKNAKLLGVVTVKSSFGNDGVPIEVADQGSTLPDKEVVNCVVGVFRSLRYPTSRAGQVTFVYPIKLGS